MNNIHCMHYELYIIILYIQLIIYVYNLLQVPVKIHDGQLYVRVSAHVYNDLSEFQHFADVITKMAAA